MFKKTILDMQKLLLTCLMLLCGGLAEAQIVKGRWTAGGSANVRFDNTTDVLIRADAGYFFTDNLAIGARVLSSVGNTTFAGISGRYCWPLAEKTYVYGQADVLYEFNGSIALNLYPGVMYFLNDRVALDGRIGGLGGGGIGLTLLF